MNKKITHEGIDFSQLEELIKEAKKVILSLDLDNKIQVIRDIIDRCIVKGGNTVEVIGHLPLFTVNMGYEPIGWDAQNVTQHFIPFSFKLRLPNLRKARIIIERNKLGQIEKARAPFVKTHHFKP